MTASPSSTEVPKKQLRVPMPVRKALLVFGLVSAVVLTSLPQLHASGKTPPFWLFLLTGLIMIGLTGGLFAYLDRLKLGFSRSALVLIFGYNAIIVLIKFVLSPTALYAANAKAAFDDELGDPNTFWFFIPVAAFILVLYVAVFTLLYKYVRRQHLAPGQAASKPASAAVNKPKRRAANVTLIVLGIIGLVGSGGIILILPWLFFGSSFNYLDYVLSALGAPILLAIALAIILAQRSFEEVKLTATSSSNATLLASFFWLGLSLILLFHVLWIVFMLTLVQIWPFNTYSPK